MFVLLTTFPALASAFTREALAQAYDDAGEFVSVEHSGGPKLRYAYRKDGALMEAAADDVVVAFERDALGQIVKETVTGIEDDAEDWVASAYDHRGLRLRLESSRGSAADIVRDAMGDVTSVAYRDPAHRWSATFSRDRLGLEVDRVVGSGESAVRGDWWRDALGRLTQHWIGQASAPEGASPVSHRLRKYGWDPGDLLRSLEDDALGSIAYEHDVRGFLQKAEITPKDGGEARVELRNPDNVGNLFASLDRNDREYGQAGQVLKRSGPEGVTTYRYDADGNLAQRVDPDGGRWWFHWNGVGQLVQVDRPGGSVVTFRYDAFGRRVEKNADGVVTRSPCQITLHPIDTKMAIHPHNIRLTENGLLTDGTVFSHGTHAADLANVLSTPSRVVASPRGRDPKARKWYIFDELGIHALEDHLTDQLLAITVVFAPEDTIAQQAIPAAAFPGVSMGGRGATRR